MKLLCKIKWFKLLVIIFFGLTNLALGKFQADYLYAVVLEKKPSLLTTPQKGRGTRTRVSSTSTGPQGPTDPLRPNKFSEKLEKAAEKIEKMKRSVDTSIIQPQLLPRPMLPKSSEVKGVRVPLETGQGTEKKFKEHVRKHFFYLTSADILDILNAKKPLIETEAVLEKIRNQLIESLLNDREDILTVSTCALSDVFEFLKKKLAKH